MIDINAQIEAHIALDRALMVGADVETGHLPGLRPERDLPCHPGEAVG